MTIKMTLKSHRRTGGHTGRCCWCNPRKGHQNVWDVDGEGLTLCRHCVIEYYDLRDDDVNDYDYDLNHKEENKDHDNE